MDFDEYEYLEKTVENPMPPNQSENGNTGKSGEKERSSKSSRLRTDENNSGSDDRAKRSRSEDEHRDRDRDRRRERGSSHHRSSSEHRSRDGERSDRDRHRSSRDRRDREEKSGREKDGDREHDRHQDRESEKDKERDRDRERERDRSRRSRSRSERHRNDRDRDSERDRDREKSKERELKERERERERERELKERERELRERERELRERERERESRRYKDKKEEVAEPEADPERDQRTVFAYQICLKADERDVYEFFSRAGKVRDVRLIMDRNSRRSKGVGYIEFYDAMSVPMAIALSGQPLLGQPVMVKPSEAEKNLVQSNATAAGSGSIGPYSGGARRLYVGNLHFNITEDQLRQVFEPFGAVELVQLPLDLETGHCKGFGFVQFTRLEDARAAQNLNGQLEIAGRLIKVSAVSDQVGMQDIGTNAGDFDDDEGGGLALNARSRALLMQKLDRTGTATSITGSLTTPLINGTSVPLTSAPTLGITPLVSTLGQPSIPAIPGLSGSVLPVGTALVPQIDPIGSPTECLLLKNMFDPMLETEDDFDMDIKEDVLDECSKFGSVKHIFVDKNSAGHVYLRFEAANSAVNAQRALHGRWFAGKMITATYMSPQNYDAKFPNI